jgi:hypothetical protein
MTSSTPIQNDRPIEFTEGDHVVTITPLGAKTRVDISMRGLALGNPAPFGETLLLLHRLNAVAHGVPPWIISIDEEDILVLGAVFPSADTQALAAHISEGIARAKALDALWQTTRNGHPLSESTEQQWAATLDPLQMA